MKKLFTQKLVMRVGVALLLMLLTTTTAWADGSWTSGDCTVTLSGGTLTVSGSGAMADYSYTSDRPWYSNRNSIESVVINEGVTRIGASAFSQCQNIHFTSVAIPPSVTSIGDNAFRDCIYLATVNFEAGSQLTEIGMGAFNNCSKLASITIPDGVTVIREIAFEGCTTLASVTIYSKSLTTYGQDAFRYSASGRKVYVFNDCVSSYQSRWSAYSSDIKPIPDLTVNFDAGSTRCWCTYYNGLADVTVPSTTTVYTGKVVGGNLTLTETGSQIIKKGQAVILRSNPNIKLYSAASSGDGDYTDNELKGVDYDTTTPANCYTLSRGSAGTGPMGFYQYSGATVAANKAYLIYTAPSPSRGFIGLGDDTTGIDEVIGGEVNNVESESSVWYTLDGRRISGQPTKKDIYVREGKKFIIK